MKANKVPAAATAPVEAVMSIRFSVWDLQKLSTDLA